MTPPRSGFAASPPGGRRWRTGRAGSAAAAWIGALVFVVASSAVASTLRQELLDDLRDASVWKASASDQVKASLRRDGDGSLCLDVDFAGVSGYAVMRRELPMQWPERFDLVAKLKARGATNDFQFKLVDASGDNVWWMNRPNAVLPNKLADLKIRRRHIGFAWGPTADKALKATQFVEFVIAAGRDGGRSSVCLAGLRLQEREPDPVPELQALQTLRKDVLDLDLQRLREFNGLALRWPVPARGLDYDVQASDDGRRWRALRRVRGSDGGLDTLYLPEQEARHLRIHVVRGSGSPTVELRSAGQWPHPNAVLAELAADAPRGDLPRAFVGEQNYWTLVGVDGGGERSGLLSEDGAIEVGRGGYSLEPAVLLDDGRRITWAGVKATQSLLDGYLPQAQVGWVHDTFTLSIEACADGPRDAPELLARYRLRNTGTTTRRYTLMLALRPWQVNPPQQFLSTQGGVSPVQLLQWRGASVKVNGRPPLRFTQAPDRTTARPLDGGVSLAALQAAPALVSMSDPLQQASALLQWQLTLTPGEERAMGWAAPLGARAASKPLDTRELDQRFNAAAADWRERLNRTTLRLPAAAQPIVDTLRTSLAHMLMSRDGPALRPGTRSYARTWVRDGAMMVAGLVRLGETTAAREFVDWYAGHIFASGKVPCCVDQRGADPVVENDSHGQYLYAVAEVWRHTQDLAFLQRHWPQVLRVMAWMEALRQSERSDTNRTPARAHLFGLMPPSISHEGYSDKAAYSYWDDFWALRGFKDGVLIASALGHTEPAARWAGWRDQFQRELVQSIAATARHHGIGFIAGAADRGDFDATSTTMALNPAQAELPPGLLDATFERYWQEMHARSEGRRTWTDYTPYELRTVGALARLGQPDRAHAMLDFFFKDQRPKGWNQWAEVVLPNPREPKFLGDMPHAWVSSDYIRSALDLLAYEREADDAIVIGAGWKPAWLTQGDGIELRGLSTRYGPLDFALKRHAGGWTLTQPRAMRGLRGGLRLVWPQGLARPRALQGTQVLAFDERGELRLPDGPFTVELQRN